MKVIKQRNRQAVILVTLIGCVLLFWIPFVNAQINISQMSIDEPLFLQGIVKRISLDKKTIFVKQGKGKKLKIQVNEQTAFIGMLILEELKQGQRIKVWYTAVGDINIAEKVERLPDLGC